MSVGGKVTDIVQGKDHYFVEITDKKEVQWRSLEINEKSRCVGLGDSIWWQNHQAYWTPMGSKSIENGPSDIKLGKCYGVKSPYEHKTN